MKTAVDADVHAAEKEAKPSLCDLDEQYGSRACAREGCKFAATWHESHCCAGCARGVSHGGRCEKLVMKTTVDADVPTAEEEGNPRFDMTFPVEVGDGRCLSISWNHGDDPHCVAQGFADEHGICTDEISTIKAFVQQATALSNEDVKTTSAPTATATAELKNVEVEASEEVAIAADEQLEDKSNDAPNDSDDALKPKNDAEGFELVETVAKSDVDSDLLKTAAHLADAGLGSVDVLLDLLKAHNGSVQRTLEDLLNQP